jgi:hypothetical protein
MVMNFEVYALAILLCGYEWISHGRLRLRIAMGYLVGGERYTKNYIAVKGVFHEKNGGCVLACVADGVSV